MESRIWRTLLLGASVALALALSACGGGNSEGPCGPSNCGGCCLLGQCVMPSGQNSSACGTQGAMCAPCASGQTCDWVLGGCGLGSSDPGITTSGSTPCGSTCAGCCDAMTGKCLDVAQQNHDNCGMSNQDCRPCASAESCSSGRCRRGGGDSPDECDPSIECFSQTTGQCELGLTRQNCGVGASCLQCGKDEWCSNGTCEPATTAISACLDSCSGDGCCNADGRCIKFAKDSSADGFWGELLSGGGSLSNTQNDSNCGSEKCLKCPAGYRCDTQVGECIDERYIRDFRICVTRVVVETPPRDAVCVAECETKFSDAWATDMLRSCTRDCDYESYGSSNWFTRIFGGDLWGEKDLDIAVTVKAGGESGTTKSKTGREDVVKVVGEGVYGTKSIVEEQMAENCGSLFKGLWHLLYAGVDDCMDKVREEATITYGNKNIDGYVVNYGKDCPLRVSEDELRGGQVEFIVEEVDLTGSKIGECVGHIAGWNTLESGCDRSGLSRCVNAALASYKGSAELSTAIKDDPLLRMQLNNCNDAYAGCNVEDGLVGSLPIKVDCGGSYDSDHVKLIQASAIPVRSSALY